MSDQFFCLYSMLLFLLILAANQIAPRENKDTL